MSKFGFRNGPEFHPSDMVDLTDLYAELLATYNSLSQEYKLVLPEKFSSDLLDEFSNESDDTRGMDLMDRTLFLTQIAHTFFKLYEIQFQYIHLVKTKSYPDSENLVFQSVVKHKYEPQIYTRESGTYQAALTWCLRKIRLLIETR